MSRQSENAVSLDSLAEGLGMDARVFRDKVSALGFDQALTADGRVPSSRVEELVEGVRRNRPASANGYDSYMRSLGVRRLDEQPAKPKLKAPPPRPSPTPVPRPAASVQPPAPKAGAVVSPAVARSTTPPSAPPSTAPPSSAAPSAMPPSAAPQPSAPVVPPPSLELERLREQLQEASREAERARARVAMLDESLAAQASRAEAAEQDLARAAAHIADQDSRLAALQASLDASQEQAQRARIPEAPPPMSLVELLVERGLVGEDEGILALRSLLDMRRLAPLGAHLKAPDPEPVRTLLRTRLVLHCGQRDCQLPPNTAPIPVSRERCEVCGGSDSARSLKRLSELLMLNGVRRVIFVGGSPAYHKVLRDGFDARIDLTLVPGDARRTRAQAESDMERAQLVVVWGGTVLDHSVSDLYRGGPARVVRIAHRGLGRMLDLVRQALESNED